MFRSFVLITGALDFLVGIAAAAPAVLDPQPGTFVPFLTLGAFLFFAAAALMWSAQDLAVRAPVVFWQGLVRLVAVVSSLYAVNQGLAPAQLYGIAAFDGVICVVYLAGTCKLTGASTLQLVLGRTS